VRPQLTKSADLLNLMQSKRIALASKVDRGEMRREDADVEFDAFKVSIFNEERRRNAEESAQTAAALQGIGMAMMAMNQTPAPAPIMAPMLIPPTNCRTVFNRGGTASTTCY